MAFPSARHLLHACGLLAMLCPAIPARALAPGQEPGKTESSPDADHLGQAAKAAAGQARQSIMKMLEQFRDSLAKDEDQARRKLGEEIQKHLDYAREHSAEIEKQVDGMVDQAVKKYREQSPERQAEMRDQIMKAERMFREQIGRQRERLESRRRDPKPSDRTVDQDEVEKLRGKLHDAEARIETLEAELKQARARAERREPDARAEARERQGVPPGPAGRQPQVGPRGRGPNPAAPNVEQRLRNFEDKLDRLMKEIESMKKKDRPEVY